MKEVKIFISHASDSETECQSVKNIITEETKNHFLSNEYIFKPICYKDIIPGRGQPQEEKIDPEIVDQNCRLIVLLLKNRLGTIQKDGKTGIEHEYELAKSLDKEIMIYHCDFYTQPSEIEPKQLQATNDFILNVKNEGLIEDRILSVDELCKIFRNKFSQWANKFISSEIKVNEFRQYSKGFYLLRGIAEEHYSYPKVKEIVSNALEIGKEGKVILIVGQPGSGKSVFMNQLYDEFNNKGLEYFTAIKTEFLTETDLPKEVYGLFEKVKEENSPKVLLLDSLDVLAYSHRKELQEWLLYVDKLRNIKGMTVICASRSFEAEHLYPMNEQEWSEKISIELLSDEFINKVLSKLNYDYKSISLRLREFLRVPLHLKIAAEIIKKGGDPKDICDLRGLYAKLIELLNISTEEMNLLSELAELMIEKRTIYLSYTSLNAKLLDLFDHIKKMERPGITGIIQIDSTNQRLSFSHQTLIDYFSAWKVINENKTVIDFVLEHRQNLFIRPVLRHILGSLRLDSERRLFEELDKLFLDKSKSKSIRMHIKTAVIANIASWDNPTIEEGKLLLRIFREANEGQTFVIQFFNSEPNPEWLDVLKDIYILPVLKNKNESDIAYRIILSFLVDIIKDKPSEVLDISLLLLNQEYSTTIELFFTRISDELIKIELDNSLKERFVDILEQAVRKNFIRWQYEISKTCNIIAKYFPEKGLKLYFDLVLAELQNEETEIDSSQRKLSESYYDVLPLIYKKIPFHVLLFTTDFFKRVLSGSYSREKNLFDSPSELLYSQRSITFGLSAFYEWYKNKMIEFCSNLTEETKQLIKILQESKWETQRQLSMLCKMRNISFFKDDILIYIKCVLKSDFNNPEIGKQYELFIRAIGKLFEVILPQERDEIVNLLLKLEFDDELEVRAWIWRPLNYILEIYQDERISKKIKELEEKYNFGEYKYEPPISSSDAQYAQPIVKAEKLRTKSQDELYKFLIENQNLEERWDIKEDIFYGGVNELAQEVAIIFSEDLKKYKNVIENLSKDSENDVYLKWLFWKLSEKGGTYKEYISWLIELINSVYKREKLQLEIIRFLRKEAYNLSESQFNKLMNILYDLSNAKDPEKDKFFEYRKQGYSNDALTEGINSTRGALVELVISLLSKFKDNIVLLEILENLSKDKTISVRAVLIRDLPYAIRSIGWDKCFKLFSNAFKKGAEEYSEYISDFLRYVPNDKIDKLKDILSKMREKRDGKLGEPYALIITIYYLRGIYSEEDLMEVFRDIVLIDKAKEESFNLLAYQIRYEENVDKCLKIVDKLIEEDILKGRLSILFMEAKSEDLEKFTSIIEKIIKKPKIRGETLYAMLEYLEKSILVNPLEVFNLLENLLSKVGDDFYNLKDYIPASHSKAPLNIINTIIECYPEEENRALGAIDKLIKLNWQGVNEYLYALDRL